jgi:hypoxanthine phosphoribosyltransferase
MNGMEAYRNGIKRVLITKEQIQEAVEKAGKQIAEIYDGSPILLVGILKGSFVFMSDMVRAIDAPCEIDFMCAKSYYSGTSSSGMVNITKDLEHEDLTGYHLVILEDIVDTGRTVQAVKGMLANKGAASVKIVTLLDKPSKRVCDVNADYVGFEIDDYFVVGFGLDYNEKYRNLPFVGILKPEVWGGK